MSEELKADKVFISYSWEMTGREEWVYDLATRLTHDNVEVVFDKWDCEEGQNLNAFMQRSVNDPSITKVLVICDESYTQKADGFKGGVGTETVIISNEVYKDVEQTKFIPIIAQRGNEGEEYIPTYLKGTKYIDMSSEQSFEDGYEKLIRNLYHKPEFIRPERGKPPIHLLRDQKKSNLISITALNRFHYLAEKRPKKINIYINDFYDAFYKDYVTYAILNADRSNLAEQVYSSFHEMEDIRNTYIDFLEIYIRETDEIDSQQIIDFFEALYPLSETKIQSNTYYEDQFDHMKLFITELMIYTIAILFKYEKYLTIKELIKNHYFVYDGLRNEQNGAIGIFRNYPRILEEVQPHSKNSSGKYISYSGQLILERANKEGYESSDLVQADFLIFLLSFSFGKFENYGGWYPPTSPYFTNQRIQVLNRLKSIRYFERVKELFDVSNKDEMKELIKRFQGFLTKSGIGSPFGYRIALSVDEIAKY